MIMTDNRLCSQPYGKAIGHGIASAGAAWRFGTVCGGRPGVGRCAAVLLAAVWLLGACSKSPLGPHDGDPVEIAPEVRIPSGVVVREGTPVRSGSRTGEARSGDRARAVADPTQPMTLYFARADQTASGTWGAWASKALKATRPAGDGAQRLTFIPSQYYNNDGRKARLLGWYPGGAAAEDDAEGSGYFDGAAGTVSWTLDGSQDILIASPQEGSMNDPMPALAFKHALAQVQLYVYTEEASAADQYGEVQAIQVTGQRERATLTLQTVTDDAVPIVFSGNADAVFTTKNVTAQKPPVGKQNAIAVGDPVMIEPQSACRLQLTVQSEFGGDQLALLPVHDYAAGQIVRVYLGFVDPITTPKISFKVFSIDDYLKEEELEPMGGSFVKDSTIIIVREYSSRPLHEPWPVTPEHAEAAWNANLSGFNTSGEQFEVASTNAKTAATFWLSATSACAVYDTPSGSKGQWRLPTAKELQMIYDMKEQLSTLDPLEGIYWAATNFSANPGNVAWRINLSNGDTDTHAKADDAGMVRCVRDYVLGIVPEGPKYPYLLSPNIIVVQDEQGQADADRYPLHEAVWPVTPAHTEAAWNANVSLKNTVGKKFKVASTDATQDAVMWTDAANACLYYNTPDGSKGQWRLPTVRELHLIYEIQAGAPANMPYKGEYWSATGHSTEKTSAWKVNFGDNGAASASPQTAKARVCCVRDDGIEAYPYVQGGDMIVLVDEDGSVNPHFYPLHDKWTTTPDHKESRINNNNSGFNSYARKFVVSDCVGSDTTYVDSKAACSNYNTPSGTKGQWRLPTVRELELIFNKRSDLNDVVIDWNHRIISATQYHSIPYSEVLWWMNEPRKGTIDFNNYLVEHDIHCVRDID